MVQCPTTKPILALQGFNVANLLLLQKSWPHIRVIINNNEQKNGVPQTQMMH